MLSTVRSGVQRVGFVNVGEGGAVAVDEFGSEHIAIQH